MSTTSPEHHPESSDTHEIPHELDTRRLVRRGLVVVVAIVVLVLIALLAPGLGSVRTILEPHRPGSPAPGTSTDQRETGPGHSADDLG